MREAEDIIRDVKDRFNAYISSSSSIKKLTDAVESGAASLIDADEFACELARCYNQALHDVVGDMSIEEYASIVEHVLPSGFHSMGSLSGAYTEHVINDQLRNAGYGLKAVPAPYSSYKEREVLSEILKRIETSGSVSEVEKTASKQVESFAQKAVMDTMSKNAREESNAGVVVKVTRIYDGVGVHDREDECKWCLRRCCTDKPYSEAKKMGTFERHPGCHCEIFYTTGKRTFRQTGR